MASKVETNQPAADSTAPKKDKTSSKKPAAESIFGSPFPPVVLASQSPRRKELLGQIGLSPKMVPAHVNEVVFHQTFKEARALVTALSQAKCRSVVGNYDDSLVIAADTVVTVDGIVLGKPKDEADARNMLSQLQGQTHEVVTSISVNYRGRMLTDCQTTAVTMQQLDDGMIARYVATGEPMDKAGAYAIQGMAGAFVEKIDGCYFNVVGMSLSTLRQLIGHLVG